MCLECATRRICLAVIVTIILHRNNRIELVVATYNCLQVVGYLADNQELYLCKVLSPNIYIF